MIRTIKRFSGFLLFLNIVPMVSVAQNEPQQQQPYSENVLYNENRFPEGMVVQWPYLREADAIYRKRVWRIIDLREKNNKVMTWPRNAFADIVLKYARSGQLHVYADPDSMVTPLTPEDASKRASIQTQSEVIDSAQNPDILLPTFDPTTAITKTVTIDEPRRWSTVQKFRVMEEWVFDKNHGKIITRIIAITPIADLLVNGDATGEVYPLFTIKYSELREVLVNEQLYNRFNDAMRLTYDDWFENRLFSSYIIKESNMYDYYIKNMPEYEKDNLAALLEADRIKQELFIFEHDLWEY